MGRRKILENVAEAWQPARIDNKKELTIIDAIEQVVVLAKESAFCPAFYRAAKRPLEYLADRLSLSVEQVALYAIFVNFSNDSRISLGEITEFAGCTQIEILRRAADMEELKKRRFIRRNGNKRGEIYYVTPAALKAVKENSSFDAPQISGLTIYQFFEVLGQYINERKDEECDYIELCNNIRELLENNRHLPFVERLKSFNLTHEAQLLFLSVCCMYINADDKVVLHDDVAFLFEYQYIARDIFAQLSSGKHPLITLGLIQPYGAEMARLDLFELGRVATEEVLAELNITTKKQNIMQSLMSHKEITPKQLFYNQSEETQITQLETLLQPMRFEQVCDKLTTKGMRRGFACLFYGAPGTGKTETVLQLARKTGRDILQVNVSELRDKYVGESEKRVKALFDNYRKTVASSKIAPILLFNEADAIISKRTENIARSVDKMENALQNIILQEIETLEGILIATTNLTANMDKAFERRFLYKVEFNAPTTEAKCAIWKSMIPSLSDEDARLLATEYKFSGGQIENIARKHTIAQILTESDITLNDIRLICNEELLDKSHTRRPIGF